MRRNDACACAIRWARSVRCRRMRSPSRRAVRLDDLADVVKPEPGFLRTQDAVLLVGVTLHRASRAVRAVPAVHEQHHHASYGADRLGDVSALTDGYSAAFIGAGAIAAVGAVVTAITLRSAAPRPENTANTEPARVR